MEKNFFAPELFEEKEPAWNGEISDFQNDVLWLLKGIPTLARHAPFWDMNKCGSRQFVPRSPIEMKDFNSLKLIRHHLKSFRLVPMQHFFLLRTERQRTYSPVQGNAVCGKRPKRPIHGLGWDSRGENFQEPPGKDWNHQ
jgi:hypothetical protein